VNSLAGTLLAPNLLLALPQPNGSVTALTGVTFTQSLSEELLVYGGKLNTQDDFEQPLTGASNLTGFQNTAMLYNPVFARTIPYSTFGAGFDCLQNEETVFAACVYDTNDTPTASGFDTFFDNGATVYAELNLPTTFFDLPGHQGFSGTYSSGKYTNLAPSAYLDPIAGLVIVSTLKTGSWCVAYNFDQALYVSPEDPERMWGVFGNFGIADNNPSPVRWFASAGISGASQIAGRNADSFGVTYFYLGVSDPLKDLAPTLLPLRDEQGVELYYNIAVTPWFQISPDLQVIIPFRDRANTAILFGLRANVDF
jgi:porin